MPTSLLIALDLDNTVADFTSGFASWLSNHRAFRGRIFPAHSHYDFVQAGWFNSFDEFTHYFQTAENDGLYESLALADGASAAIREILNRGHTVKAVTARSERFAEETLRWLSRNSVPVEEVIHTEAKEVVPADVFIDDAPAQIEKFFGYRGLLVPTMPYNKHLADGCHFASWSVVPDLLNQHV